MIATLTGASFTRNPKYSRITNPMKISRIRMNLRSEEHTSELQSPCNLVCRLLLEKKKNKVGVKLARLARRAFVTRPAQPRSHVHTIRHIDVSVNGRVATRILRHVRLAYPHSDALH